MSNPSNLQVLIEMEKATNSKDEVGFPPSLPMFALGQAANANTPCIQEGRGWLLEQYVHSCEK